MIKRQQVNVIWIDSNNGRRNAQGTKVRVARLRFEGSCLHGCVVCCRGYRGHSSMIIERFVSAGFFISCYVVCMYCCLKYQYIYVYISTDIALLCKVIIKLLTNNLRGRNNVKTTMNKSFTIFYLWSCLRGFLRRFVETAEGANSGMPLLVLVSVGSCLSFGWISSLADEVPKLLGAITSNFNIFEIFRLRFPIIAFHHLQMT